MLLAMNAGCTKPLISSLKRPSGLARKNPSFHPAVIASWRRLARVSESASTSSTMPRICPARSSLSHFSPSMALRSATCASSALFFRSSESMRCSRASSEVLPASALLAAGVAAAVSSANAGMDNARAAMEMARARDGRGSAASAIIGTVVRGMVGKSW
jgi:hypothetical protein